MISVGGAYMIRFKKMCTIGLSLVLAVGMTACSSKVKEKKLNVNIWDENQRAGIQEILKDFTSKTGINTEITVVDWRNYWTQLSAGASGGQLPDVFWMHSNESQKYMSNGLLMDLTERIANSKMVQLENYPKDIAELYASNGKQYAIPKDIDTIALWYNKTMFDKAGVAYPTDDWTWEDLYKAAKKITDKKDNKYGFVMQPDSTQAGYYNLIYDKNSYVISEDKKQSGFSKPETVEAIKLWHKMVKDVMPPLNIITENREEGCMQNGLAAMSLQGSWMLPAFEKNEYIAKNFAIAKLPKDSKTNRCVSLYNGLGWAIAANTKLPNEAWQLVEFLGSKEAQQKQADLGVTMSAYKGTSDNWIKHSKIFDTKAYLDMMQDTVIRPYSKNTVAWENCLIELMTKMYSDELSAEDTCSQFAKKMNAILAEEK